MYPSIGIWVENTSSVEASRKSAILRNKSISRCILSILLEVLVFGKYRQTSLRCLAIHPSVGLLAFDPFAIVRLVCATSSGYVFLVPPLCCLSILVVLGLCLVLSGRGGGVFG